MLNELNHVVVGGGRELLCHWPRQGGVWHWGRELLVAYIESPCDYTDEAGTDHGQGGIWKRGYIRLRRSLDGGATWEGGGIPFDNSRPVEEQRRILRLDDYHWERGPERERLDMDGDDAIFLMGRSWCGREFEGRDGRKTRANVTFCYRSVDRGHHWERIPSILWPDHTHTLVELANNTMKLGHGRVLAWVEGYNGVESIPGFHGTLDSQLYLSEDHGVTWNFFSEIVHDDSDRVAYAYPHVVALPSGELLAFLGCWNNAGGPRTRWTEMCRSEDGGLNWSRPRRIHAWSISPYPLVLRDGRVLLFYMRRNPDPTGMYVLLSEDEGRSWSAPMVIRDDCPAAGPRGVVDGGYPVAVELADGRVFVAYYWMHDDPDIPWLGGRKFIAGSFFRI